MKKLIKRMEDATRSLEFKKGQYSGGQAERISRKINNKRAIQELDKALRKLSDCENHLYKALDLADESRAVHMAIEFTSSLGGAIDDAKRDLR